jgi:predicted nuclease of predicted toxin-antitoxin system
MLRLAADENFNNDIVRGLRRKRPDLDIVRVQEAGLSGAVDPDVLEWAARESRILLTHDASTMTRYAYERVAVGLPMPGVFQLSRGISLTLVIEDILLIAECSIEGEWEGQVRYLPL